MCPYVLFFINHLGRHTRGTASAAHSGATSPPVFTEPPPDYKDLTTAKYRLSEDLPRYEDLVKHDRSNNDAASKFSPQPPVLNLFRQSGSTLPFPYQKWTKLSGTSFRRRHKILQMSFLEQAAVMRLGYREETLLLLLQLLVIPVR